MGSVIQLKASKFRRVFIAIIQVGVCEADSFNSSEQEQEQESMVILLLPELFGIRLRLIS